MLLIEDYRRNIAERLGLPPTIANFFHLISKKNSFNLARTFQREMLTLYNKKYRSIHVTEFFDKIGGLIPDKNNLSDIVNDLNRTDTALRNIKQTLLKYVELQHFFNWYDNQNEVKYQLKNIRHVGDYIKLSDKWHKSLQVGSTLQNTDKLKRGDEANGVIFLRFPDGYYWVNLKTQYSKEEETLMGHCADTNLPNGVLLSLRDKSSNSHITVGYSESEKFVNEIKGKNNSKPKEKYHKYIIGLLLNNKYPIKEKVLSNYKPHLDFHISDLKSESVITALHRKNPKWFTTFDYDALETRGIKLNSSSTMQLNTPHKVLLYANPHEVLSIFLQKNYNLKLYVEHLKLLYRRGSNEISEYLSGAAEAINAHTRKLIKNKYASGDYYIETGPDGGIGLYRNMPESVDLDERLVCWLQFDTDMDIYKSSVSESNVFYADCLVNSAPVYDKWYSFHVNVVNLINRLRTPNDAMLFALGVAKRYNILDLGKQ